MVLFLKIALILTIGWNGCIASNTTPDPNTPPVPIVLWHGMGDACCLPFSLGAFKKFLESKIEGVYVKSLMIGNSITQDIENGFFMSPNKQVEIACRAIKNDPKLSGGFNAMGFSQGSQFLRAVLQRCGHFLPPMFSLISMGGQHQGVYGLPHCGALRHESCDYIRRLLNHAAYYSWVQDFLVQATYWHDPLNENLYKKNSKFLADINNENYINKTYVENLNRLSKFVLVKFMNDSMVQPVDTEWFGFYKPGQAKEILQLQDTELYLQDRIGLQTLDLLGKLDLYSVIGDHLQFSDEWFMENIIKYLT